MTDNARVALPTTSPSFAYRIVFISTGPKQPKRMEPGTNGMYPFDSDRVGWV
ncbi:hypothetical protein M404DRAFT_994541 [Pisolithus tinctorius Marx 270]|uniref:Uncharacterized protein n=1 Tax=Pisolithus tinctorius Marx 270 TaxID=870435 RepID=A0A0C3PT56_PISTI|nr:hypothetical protein M404DRAFT_994541 [Pisolithus tinctorius Marx 270]